MGSQGRAGAANYVRGGSEYEADLPTWSEGDGGCSKGRGGGAALHHWQAQGRRHCGVWHSTRLPPQPDAAAFPTMRPRHRRHANVSEEGPAAAARASRRGAQDGRRGAEADGGDAGAEPAAAGAPGGCWPGADRLQGLPKCWSPGAVHRRGTAQAKGRSSEAPGRCLTPFPSGPPPQAGYGGARGGARGGGGTSAKYNVQEQLGAALWVSSAGCSLQPSLPSCLQARSLTLFSARRT